MKHPALPLVVVLALAWPALADEAAREEAFRLAREGQRLTREAMHADDPGPTCDQALERFRKAKDLLVAELRASPEDAEALEREVVNIDAMVFWCQRLEPAVGPRPAQPPPATEPPPADAERLAEEACRAVEALEREAPGDAFVLMTRYFEVAERWVGTRASVRAQRRSLELQRQLMAERPPPAASEPAAPPAAPARPALAERLAQALRCGVRPLEAPGAFEVTFDFADPAQREAWVHWKDNRPDDWRVVGDALLGQSRDGKPGWLQLLPPFEGDVSLEVEATLPGDDGQVSLIIHGHPVDAVGYGVWLGAGGTRTARGVNSWSWTRETGALKAGKAYKLALKQERGKVELRVAGKVVWASKESALTEGVIWLGARGRVSFGEVKVTGRVQERWLRERRLAD